MVFNSAVMNKVSFNAPGPNNRDLTVELYERLEHGVPRTGRLPGVFKAGRSRELELPLAVVAEVCGLKNGREAELASGVTEFFKAANVPERGDWEACLAQERFSRSRCWVV